jgi:hypothetical protein
VKSVATKVFSAASHGVSMGLPSMRSAFRLASADVMPSLASGIHLGAPAYKTTSPATCPVLDGGRD